MNGTEQMLRRHLFVLPNLVYALLLSSGIVCEEVLAAPAASPSTPLPDLLQSRRDDVSVLLFSKEVCRGDPFVVAGPNGNGIQQPIADISVMGCIHDGESAVPAEGYKAFRMSEYNAAAELAITLARGLNFGDMIILCRNVNMLQMTKSDYVAHLAGSEAMKSTPQLDSPTRSHRI